MSEVTLKSLKLALRSSWSAETSYCPQEWSDHNVDRGQCVVSALLVQDYFGGDLGRYLVKSDGVEEKHYFNILGDETLVDTTISQYKGQSIFEHLTNKLGKYSNLRDKVLSDEDTKRRYNCLAEQVARALSS